MLAYIVVWILARPIKRLTQEMVTVTNPYYRPILVSTRRDEIGLDLGSLCVKIS